MKINLIKRGGLTYDEFSREGLDISLEFSNKLKKIKSKKGENPARNIRISTALPISYDSKFMTEDSEFNWDKNLQEKIREG